ncbi:MAG: DUF692 domain-containing protein [Acidobacteriota bacterium]
MGPMISRSMAPHDGTAAAGIGLRSAHVAEIAATRPALGFLEVHAENYMSGSPALAILAELRRDYPVSLHGVGLSLGSAGDLDRAHLARFRALVDRLDPVLVSEHLSWSGTSGIYLNDLLPMPYTEETLAVFCRHVDEAQEALGRRLLIENPSVYLRFRHSTIDEAEFLAALAERTGCGILCDVNNLYVNSENFGLDPIAYLDALPAASVGEIHLAGHHRGDADGTPILIDDHGSSVAEPVWRLYREALARFGRVPSLVEWDARLPALDVLLGEADHADAIAAACAPMGGLRACA